MRPKERRETRQTDLFKARLDQIVDLNHALVNLARSVDWGFLEKTFGAVYNDGPGGRLGTAWLARTEYGLCRLPSDRRDRLL